MKYKVVRNFNDKFAGQFYKVGELLSDKEKRIDDYLAAGVVEIVEQNFNELTVKEIKKLLDERNIEYDAKARKDELIELLQGGD